MVPNHVRRSNNKLALLANMSKKSSIFNQVKRRFWIFFKLPLYFNNQEQFQSPTVCVFWRNLANCTILTRLQKFCPSKCSKFAKEHKSSIFVVDIFLLILLKKKWLFLLNFKNWKQLYTNFGHTWEHMSFKWKISVIDHPRKFLTSSKWLLRSILKELHTKIWWQKKVSQY